jgi:D-glycero-alpha-D-manno-heptose 1-phosphate guanylyltransferase
MEVILLAGGLGTRLKSVVNDVPKCMSIVAGKPFLEHIFNYLENQFVDHVILSLGYKSEVVIEWLRSKAFTFKVSWVIEKEALGTGGAIKFAMQKAKNQWLYIMNADTYFPISLRDMSILKTDSTIGIIALKELTNCERYGLVNIDVQQTITSFEEKQPTAKGLINGGIYYINRKAIDWSSLPTQFSFESCFLEPNVKTHNLKAKVFDEQFIDIGIPEDYEKAQHLDYN